MSRFDFEAIADCPETGPVIMLNLLQFREQSLDGNGTGREAYARYSEAARRLVEGRGGRIIWVGRIEHPVLYETEDINWDAALLVYYPSRAAFLEMVSSAEYQAINAERENALEKHLILAASTLVSNPLPES